MNGKALFTVLGTLVADPEEVQMKDKTLVKFRLAWNEKRKGGDHATYCNFECWSDFKNKHIMSLFAKGKNVAVRGTFVGDEYTIQSKPNGDEVPIKTMRFRVEDFDLLDNRKDSSESSEEVKFKKSTEEEDVPF